MFEWVPIQGWLLLVIATAAYVPARYTYRHIAHSPAKRDITQPPEDLNWRTSGYLARNLVILMVLAAFAVFIFTPAAPTFAEAPTFWPLLIGAFGVFALSTVGRAAFTGRIEPLVRGLAKTYDRKAQPKRFWASMTWNSAFSFLFLWLAFQSFKDVPSQALENRCYDPKNVYAPKENLAACDQLLGDRGKGHADMANLIAARGSARYRLGDYHRATIDYTEAVRLDPNDSSSHYNLGLVDRKLGDQGLAIDSFSAAIRADPDNADAYAQRGLLYLDTGNFDGAVADFTKGHQLKPKDSEAIARRGLTYAWKGDRRRAKEDFAAARAIDPSSVIVLRGNALLHLTAGDAKAAVRDLTEAIRRDPSDSWSLAMRREAYGRLGQLEKMRADTNELKRLDEDSRRME